VTRERLEKLLALANAPGSPAEGAAALSAAQRVAHTLGLAVLVRDGRASAFEVDTADLLEALDRIARLGEPPAGELPPNE
jgi:hypothetical protein